MKVKGITLLSSFFFQICLCAFEATLPTRIAYIAVIVDPFEHELNFNKNSSEAYRTVLTRQKAQSIFQQATNNVTSRRLTTIDRVAANVRTFLKLSSQAHWQNFTSNVDVKFEPVFIHSGYAADMYDGIVKQIAARNKTGNLRAVLEVETFGTSKCAEMKELGERFLPSYAAVFSLSCYYQFWYEDLVVTQPAPKIVYEGLVPFGIVHFTYALAVRFNWRRFHFVFSPYWPSYDVFFETLARTFNGVRPQYINQLKNGDLIFTKSYFCTEYLTKGNICSNKQAEQIVLRQATATFILLDTEKDLPFFIRQLRSISADNLSQGKALFVINTRGVMRQLYDLMKNDAPDGLMMIKTRTTRHSAFRAPLIEGFQGFDIDSIYYDHLRMLSRAVEVFEQKPEDYHNIANLYCGTKFIHEDALDVIGYADHCDRHWITYEVFNVKRSSRGNTSLEMVFTYENFKLIDQNNTPRWFGSRDRIPFEDFCKLDGTGCPPVPIDLVPIVAPSVGGFTFVALMAAMIWGLIIYRRAVRRKEEQILRNMVILNAEDIHWESLREAAMRSTEKTVRNPVEKLRKRRETVLDVFEPYDDLGDLAPKQENQEKSVKTALVSTKRLAENILIKSGSTSNFSDNLPRKTSTSQPKQKFGTAAGNHRALWRNEPVFVKKLKRQFVSVDMKLVRELLEIRNLNHQNINALLGIIIEPGRISALHQWCEKGTLETLLRKKNVKLHRIFKISFANDIANAMAYLHKSKIESHGALSPNNILIDAQWMCKVGNIPIQTLSRNDDDDENLGLEALARILMANGMPGAEGGPSASLRARDRPPQTLTQITQRQQPLKQAKAAAPLKQQGLYDWKYTQRIYMDAIAEIETSFHEEEDFFYTAPELLRIKPEERPARGSQKGDIYSFGLICFYILTKEVPFANCHLPQAILLEKLKKRKPDAVDFRPVAKEAIEDNVEELMEIAKACWEEKPDRRPRFDDICKVMMELNNGNKENNITDQMIKVLEERAEALEENLAIQLDELANEKQQVQELLGKMLPRYVVDEMHAGRYVAPKCFENATILCSNIVGFSEMAMNSNSGELIAFLDQFISSIDRVLEGRDVWKVDSFGSKMRIVSGLPKPNERHHATDVANVALEIMAMVNEFNLDVQATCPKSSLFPLRIGIHSGPMVAGIVGLEIPQYCVFGRTLETATDLEQQAPPLRIHISSATKSLLDRADRHGPPLFMTSAREHPINVKGLGASVNTFFLTGKRGFKKALPFETSQM